MLIVTVYKLARGLCHSHLPRPLILWCILPFRRPISIHAHRPRGLHARDTRPWLGRDPRRIPQAISEPSSTRSQDVRGCKITREPQHNGRRHRRSCVKRFFSDRYREQSYDCYSPESGHKQCLRGTMPGTSIDFMKKCLILITLLESLAYCHLMLMTLRISI